MSYVKRALMATIVVAGLAAQPAAAQSAQKWSLQASLFSSTLIGDNPIFKNVDPGAGFEIQLRWTPSLFSLGGGFQWTTHKQNLLADQPNVINDPNTTLNGFFLEPRYVILVGSNTIAPYISGRVSFLRQTTTAEFRTANGPATLKASADGINFNGGGGLLFRLGGRVNLDVGATYGFSNFGDFVTVVDGQEFDRAGSSSGQNLA
ncbi:MAG: outer membrane beta-barrel protein, partial [Acidimicrobiales bacterium]